MTYSTYLGGSGSENPFGTGFDIAVDTLGNAYVAGTTNSIDFPLAHALNPNIGGLVDAYVARISTGLEIMVRLEERVGEKLINVTLGNGGAVPVQVELKLWIESPGFGVFSILAPSMPVLTVPPASRFEIFSKVPLPTVFPFPGTTLGARLVNPVTGVQLRFLVIDNSTGRM